MRNIMTVLLLGFLAIGYILFHSYMPDSVVQVVQGAETSEETVSTEVCGQFYYTVLDEEAKTAKIVGVVKAYKLNSDYSTVIPDMLDGYTVTELGDEVFNTMSNVKKITLPKYVTKLGKQCFGSCTALEEIVLPDTLQSIGEAAFIHCESLKTITLPDKLEYIGASAFANCDKLVTIVIPDSVGYIGEAAFYSCDDLTTVVLPKNTVTFERNIFYNCTSLKNVVMQEGPTEITYGMFWNCSSLETIVLPGSIQSLGIGAFLECTSLKSIVLPDAVTTLEQKAFYDCTSLSQVTLSSSLSDIGINAFGNCTSLESITLPSSVTTLEKKAFYGCMALSEITLSTGLTSIGEDALTLAGDSTSETDMEPLKIIIPGDVEKVADLGLEDLSGVTFQVAEGSNVTIYFDQKNITYTTYVNSSTTEATTTEATTTEASTDATTTEATATETTTEATTTEATTTEATTQATTGATTAEAEKTVEYKIGETYQKGNLKYCILTKSTVSFVGSTNKKLTKLTIPATVKLGSKTYKVTTVSKKACKGYKKLKTVVIGKNVSKVLDEAFMNCTTLQKITFGEGVQTIGKKVLYGDKKMKTITFKTKKLKSIGKQTFTKVPKTAMITVPKGKKEAYLKYIKKAK